MSKDYVASELEAGFHLIPEHMRDHIERYVLKGIPPGSFLTAVLSNDLFGAVGKADMVNQSNLVNWCLFLHNYVPSGCKGSPQHYSDWVSEGGYLGLISNQGETA